jgi:tetratricopeptide (TPR) repeat protein
MAEAEDRFARAEDRGAAMIEWITAARQDPERCLAGPGVALEGVLCTAPGGREALVDRLWPALVAAAMATDFAERLDAAADADPEAQLDVLAARSAQRANLPAPIALHAWRRVLNRCGGDALDWEWIEREASPSYVESLASQADKVGLVLGPPLLTALLKKGSPHAGELLRRLGLDGAEQSAEALAEVLGVDAVTACARPADAAKRWSWFKVRRSVDDPEVLEEAAADLAEASRQGGRHLDLAGWLRGDGQPERALALLTSGTDSLRLELLEATGGTRVLCDLLFPAREELGLGRRVMLARALATEGREVDAAAVLEGVSDPTALALRVGVLIEVGAIDDLVAVVESRGAMAALEAAPHLRWQLFELLADEHPALAERLVTEHLGEAEGVELLNRLAELTRSDGVLGEALDLLLTREPSEARFARRLATADPREHGSVLARRALWWSDDPGRALDDLRRMGTGAENAAMALTTAAGLVRKYPHSDGLATALVDIGLSTDQAGGMIGPLLEAADRRQAPAAAALLARMGLLAFFSGQTQEAEGLYDEALARQPDAVPVLLLQARLRAQRGHRARAARDLVAEALLRPGSKAGLELAHLALELADDQPDQLEELAGLWPDDPKLVVGLAQVRLAAGAPVDAETLAGLQAMEPETLAWLWEAGLSGSLLELLPRLSDRGDPSALVEMALERGEIQILKTLLDGPLVRSGAPLEWAARALELGRFQIAYDLLDRTLESRDAEAARIAVEALAAGAHSSLAEEEGLRALDLGVSRKALVPLALRCGARSELHTRLLAAEPDHLDLIAAIRRLPVDEARARLRGAPGPVARAACIGLDTRVGQEQERSGSIDAAFESAVAQVGRRPELLAWWSESLGDRNADLLAEAIAANPGRWAADRLLRKAKGLVASDRAAALAALEEAFAIDPDFGDLRRALCDMVSLEDPERALWLVEPLLAQAEPDARDLRRAARVAERDGRLGDAVGWLLEAGPSDHPGPLQGAIDTLVRAERFETAGAWCESLIRDHGGQMVAAELGHHYQTLGGIRWAQEDREVARACFGRSLELCGRSTAALEGFGTRLIEQRATRGEGLALLLEAVDLPGGASPHLARLIGVHSEDPWQTVDFLEPLRKGADADAELLHVLAQAYERCARFELAYEVALEAVHEGGHEHLLWAGQVAEGALDDLGAALACWQAALDLDPGHSEVLQALEEACVRREAYALLAACWVDVCGRIEGEARDHLLGRLVDLAAGPLADPTVESAALGLLIVSEDSQTRREHQAELLLAQSRAQEAVHLLEPCWRAGVLDGAGGVLFARAQEGVGRRHRSRAILDACELRGQAIDWSPGPLTETEPGVLGAESLAALVPPLLAGDVGSQLAGAWRVLWPLLSRSPDREAGMFGRKRTLVHPDDDRLAVRVFYQVAPFLGQAELSLYVVPGSSESLAFFPSQPLALTVGARAALLREEDLTVLRYQIGRVVALGRAETALLALLGVTSLTDLAAAVGLRGPAGDHARIGHWRQVLVGGADFRLRKHLDEIDLDHLQELAGAAEALSIGAGMVCCADLARAVDLSRQADPLLAHLDPAGAADWLGRLWSGSAALAHRCF